MRRLVICGMTAVLLLFPVLSLAQQQEQQQRPLGTELGLGLTSVLLSVYYAPIKSTVALIGAPIGAAAGLLTGGNERVAESIWRSTIGGTYFITPDIIEGKQPFLLGGR